MDDKKATKEKAVISYIGLENQEIKAIKILCNSENCLNQNFTLKPLEIDKDIDVVLINGDCKQSIQYWKLISKNHIGSVPILLSAKAVNSDDYRTVQKPLKFKGLMRTLNSIKPSAVNDEDGSGKCFTRILVVDDSFLALQFMKFKLEEVLQSFVNVKLEFTDNIEKALELTKRIPFDLIFIDENIPDRNGYKICTLIKQRSLARIAYLTGLKQRFGKRKRKRSEGDFYLSKPAKSKELLKIIKSTIRWRNKKIIY